MKTTLFSILFLLITCSGLGQDDVYGTCKTGREEAKEAIERSGPIFVIPLGLIGPREPYYDELDTLCAENGVLFDRYPLSCSPNYDDHDHCYIEYLDSALFHLKGRNFKRKLERQAKKRFEANSRNQILDEFEVDQKAYIPGEEKNHFNDKARLIDSLNAPLLDNNPFIFKLNGVEQSMIAVSFVVDKNGQTSDFEIINTFIRYEETEEDLLEAAEAIKSVILGISSYTPAKVKNKNVASRVTERIPVYFYIDR